jgi:FkbM family methyltransferase
VSKISVLTSAVPHFDHAVCRLRRNVVFRSLAYAAAAYLRRYENFNHHIDLNGEADLMSRLSPFGFTTLFDIGANVGEWSSKALSFFPNANAHCFEIAPETARQLRGNLGGDRRVIINDVGLSNAIGKVQINFVGADSGRTSLLAEVVSDVRATRVEAQVTTGDAYMRDAGVSKIDLMKIDVEGAEPLVLEGFREALSDRKVTCIQFEFGHARWRLLDVERFFDAFGYRVGKIFPGYCDFTGSRTEFADCVVSNYFAVRNDRLDVIAAARG